MHERVVGVAYWLTAGLAAVAAATPAMAIANSNVVIGVGVAGMGLCGAALRRRR